MVNTRMKETLLEANIDPFTIEGRSDIYCRSSFLSIQRPFAAWFLDKMVAHLGLHTHVRYVEIGSIIAEVLSAWEKAECYIEAAILPVSSTLIQNNDLSYIYDLTHWKVENHYFELK